MVARLRKRNGDYRPLLVSYRQVHSSFSYSWSGYKIVVHGISQKSSSIVCLKLGSLNMMNKKMVNAGTVNNWICINFARNVTESVAHGFCYELAQMCNISGMAFHTEPVLPVTNSRPDQVETSAQWQGA